MCKMTLSKQRANNSSQLRWAVFAALVACSLFTALHVARASCPNEKEIVPCTCDDEGLRCNSTAKGLLNLPKLFSIQPAPAPGHNGGRQTRKRLAIRKVWICQTDLVGLDKHSFGDYIIRDLYLDFNLISSINADAFGLSSQTLQTLSLTRNSLTTIPVSVLEKMRFNLENLGLSYNKIKAIDKKLLASFEMSKLKQLDLASNELRYIGANAFEKLSALVILNLSKNKLKKLIANSLFVNSTNPVTSISLLSNEIEEVSPDAFGAKYPSLLDLSYNKLTYLSEKTFKPMLVNETYIQVDGNPFACTSCSGYRWLVELDSRHQNFLMGFECTDGQKLEDLSLDSIGC